jgi:hypothetical protein
MEAERRFYEANDDTEYSPLIADEKKRFVVPKLNHLVAAANEFARRFPFRTVEDEDRFAESETSSESPFLLVANKVKDSWRVPDAFLERDHPPVRFMLVPGDTSNSSILFIRCMAGPEHGKFDGAFTRDIDAWIFANRLTSVLTRLDAGGRGYEPDKAYAPETPDRLARDLDADARLKGGPFARLIVEVEYTHRTVRALRMTGFHALNNNYTRLFLCLKIWQKNANGDFGAAAVLWTKNDEGTISAVKAVDFGTRELSTNAKKGFQVAGDATMLPPVTEWTRPTPPPSLNDLEGMPFHWTGEMETNEDWCITLRKDDLLYKTSTMVSTDVVPYILDDPMWPIPNCCIYLRKFARDINMSAF